MQTTYVVVGSQTTSAWIPIDKIRNPTSISLGCTITEGASATYKVQHTFDNAMATTDVGSITRVTTTATATVPEHGLSVGDSVIVEGAGAPFDGTYAVASVTNANVFTYTVANSGLTTAQVGARIALLRVFDHASVTGKTTKSDGNYAYPVGAVRLNVTTYASGKVTLAVTQGA